MANVCSATVEYPAKKASSFTTGYRAKKPKAKIEFCLDDDSNWTKWTPVKAARVFIKNQPSYPCDKSAALDAVKDIELKCAKNQIMEMLGRRDYSAFELTDKLSIYGYRQETIDIALRRVQELHFQNDDRFTRYFIEERKRRGWGRRKIEVELKRKGIDVGSIPGYPESYFSEDDDTARAQALISRKSIPENRAFEKLVRFLMNKGFSYSISASVVKDYISGENNR